MLRTRQCNGVLTYAHTPASSCSPPSSPSPLGYRESVNLAQIRTFTEMISHDENVYEAMRKSQVIIQWSADLMWACPFTDGCPLTGGRVLSLMGVSIHWWVCPFTGGRVPSLMGVSIHWWACPFTDGCVPSLMGVSLHWWVYPFTGGRVLP